MREKREIIYLPNISSGLPDKVNILEEGKRPRGRPQKTWHTTFTEDAFGVTCMKVHRKLPLKFRHEGILSPDVHPGKSEVLVVVVIVVLLLWPQEGREVL